GGVAQQVPETELAEHEAGGGEDERDVDEADDPLRGEPPEQAGEWTISCFGRSGHRLQLVQRLHAPILASTSTQAGAPGRDRGRRSARRRRLRRRRARSGRHSASTTASRGRGPRAATRSRPSGHDTADRTTPARFVHRRPAGPHLRATQRDGQPSRVTTASPLKARCAHIAGPSRPVRCASHPATSPKRNSAGNWRGSRWAAPKIAADATRAQPRPIRRSRDRSTRPRKNSSSMTGAAITTNSTSSSTPPAVVALLVRSRAGLDTSSLLTRSSQNSGRYSTSAAHWVRI